MKTAILTFAGAAMSALIAYGIRAKSKRRAASKRFV